MKKRVGLYVLAVSIFCLSFGAVSAEARMEISKPQWQVQTSLNPDSTHDILHGVAGLSSNEAWVVGEYSAKTKSALVEHWDGKAWKVFPSATSSSSVDLYGAAGISSKDVWAVGNYNAQSDAHTPLIEHWDGKVWKKIQAAAIGLYVYLKSVSVVAANDVWAVGYAGNPQTYGTDTVTLHWDGAHWSRIASPNPGTSYNELFGVKALAKNNVWAVGHFEGGTSTSENALVEHWDGKTWKVVPSPNPGSLGSVLSSISGTGSGDVWAVGHSTEHTTTVPGFTTQPVLEHWNGTGWSIVANPTLVGVSNFLYAVKAVTASNVWAVGFSSDQSRAIIEHWDGHTWSSINSPHPGDYETLDGLDALGSTQLMAVGSLKGSQTLVETYQ